MNSGTSVQAGNRLTLDTIRQTKSASAAADALTAATIRGADTAPRNQQLLDFDSDLKLMQTRLNSVSDPESAERLRDTDLRVLRERVADLRPTMNDTGYRQVTSTLNSLSTELDNYIRDYKEKRADSRLKALSYDLENVFYQVPNNLIVKPVRATMDALGVPEESLPQRLFADMSASADAAAQREAENDAYLTPLEREVGSGLQAALATLPQVILAYHTGGMSLASTASQTMANATAVGTVQSLTTAAKNAAVSLFSNPNFWMSAIPAAADTYLDAKEAGASLAERSLASVTSGLLNGTIEVGVTGAGSGTQSFARSLRSAVATPRASSIFRQYIAAALEEGLEEAEQNIATSLVGKAIYRPQAPLLSFKDETAVLNPLREAKSYLTGVAISGLLTAPSAIRNGIAVHTSARAAAPTATTTPATPTVNRVTTASPTPSVTPDTALTATAAVAPTVTQATPLTAPTAPSRPAATVVLPTKMDTTATPTLPAASPLTAVVDTATPTVIGTAPVTVTDTADTAPRIGVTPAVGDLTFRTMDLAARTQLYDALNRHTGVRIEEVTALGTDGEYDPATHTIRIDPQSATPFTVIKHELTHHLENNLLLYQDLCNYALQSRAFDEWLTARRTDLPTLKAELTERYAAAGVALDTEVEGTAEREVMATFVAERLFTDVETLQTMRGSHPSLFVRLYQWLRDTVRYFRSTPAAREIQKLEALFARAARAPSAAVNTPATQPTDAATDPHPDEVVLTSDRYHTGSEEELSLQKRSAFHSDQGSPIDSAVETPNDRQALRPQGAESDPVQQSDPDTGRLSGLPAGGTDGVSRDQANGDPSFSGGALHPYSKEWISYAQSKGDFVIENDAQMVQFANAVLNDTAVNGTAYAGTVDSRVLQKIINSLAPLSEADRETLFSVTADRPSVSLDATALRRLANGHTGMTRTELIDCLCRLPETLRSFDNATLVTTDGEHAPQLQLQKRFADGATVRLQFAPRTDGSVRTLALQEAVYRRFSAPSSGELSRQDVRDLQTLCHGTRRSLEDLSPDLVQALQPYAERLWGDLGTKSPLFRAQFGEWRLFDGDPMPLATHTGPRSGTVTNRDTGWTIDLAATETDTHTATLLPYLREIATNAVLLDTVTVDRTTTENALFMHTFYAPVKTAQGVQAVQLVVEEMYDPAASAGSKRAYQLKNIKSQATDAKAAGLVTPMPETMSIGEFVSFVKQQFRAKEPQAIKHYIAPTDTRPSAFAETVQAAPALSDETKRLAAENETVAGYRAVSNDERMMQARRRLDKGGDALVRSLLQKDAAQFTAEEVAIGYEIILRCERQGDHQSTIPWVEKLRQVATESGQTVQLFSLLRRLTPEGVLFHAERELAHAEKSLSRGRSNRWKKEHRDCFRLSDEDARFILRRARQAAQLPAGRDSAIRLAEISQYLQRKLPPERGQAYKAWQRTAMLLNPKTQLRNVLGNLSMSGAFIGSDRVGSVIDRAIARKTGVRTTAGFRVSSLSGLKKGLFESYDDFLRHINTRNAQANRFELDTHRSENFNTHHRGVAAAPRNALSRALNALDRFNSFLLDAGDRPFYEMWFLNSLNGQMQINGVTEPTADMIEIATEEALQRTWQDSNAFTRALSDLKAALNRLTGSEHTGYGLGDVLIKFVKTPANLTKAALEFSPVGFAKAITVDAARFTAAVRDGRVTPQLQRRFVRNMANGIVGSLLTALAAGLAQSGVLIGREDDDRDVAAFERTVLGTQPYSFRIGNTTFTYDWAQPLSTTLALMADYYQQKDTAVLTGERRTAVEALGDVLRIGGQTLYNQTFMQSLYQFFSADDPVTGIIDALLSDVTAPVPQLLSQTASALDHTVRTTYEADDDIQTAVNRLLYKLPGARNTLPPSVDTLGRDRTQFDDPLARAFSSYISPANLATGYATAAGDEMYRLYRQTGNAAAIAPTAPSTIITANGRRALTARQKAAYQRTTGHIVSDSLNALLSDNTYRALSDEERVRLLSSLYTYAIQTARHEVLGIAPADSTVKAIRAAEAGIPPWQYYLLRQTADRDQNGSITQAEARATLRTVDLTAAQKSLLWRSFNSGWKNDPYATAHSYY